MRWLASLSLALLIGAGILLIVRLVPAHQALAPPSAAQWENLRRWNSTIYLVEASTANCRLPETLGPFRTAQAEAKLQALENRYGLSSDQKVALASLARAEQDIGSGAALGMTMQACEDSLHQLDGAIKEMNTH